MLVRCFGTFDNGGLTAGPDIKMTFNMRLGDVMLTRSAILEHYITPWLEGERNSCVF